MNFKVYTDEPIKFTVSCDGIATITVVENSRLVVNVSVIRDGNDGYTPVKGVDYFDGNDGYTPIKGVDYFDGNDGYTPVKGVDYFDGEKGDKGDIFDQKEFDWSKGCYFYEDFCGSVVSTSGVQFGTSPWFRYNGGTLHTATYLLPEIGANGILSQTVIAASSHAAVALGYVTTPAVYTGPFFVTKGVLISKSRIRIPLLPTNAAETFAYYDGFNQSPNANHSAFSISFLYDKFRNAPGNPSGGEDNFKCITANAGLRTYSSTSVPVVAGQWYELMIITNANGTSVSFYIDNVLVATHTTNIPTGVGLGYFSRIFKHAGSSTTFTSDIDKFQIIQTYNP